MAHGSGIGSKSKILLLFQLALVLFSGLDDYPVPKLVDMFYAKPVKLIELIERLPFTDFFGESMSQHSGVVFSPVFDFSR